MKHIAVPCRGAYNADREFTAAGLGDRIHAVTIAWSYSQAHQTHVMLHVTDPMMRGGQFGNKAESWSEILALLPPGHVSLKAYPGVSPRTAADWAPIIGAEAYCYSDYQQREGLDAVPYLRNIPLLKAEPQSIDLPERFFTTQWDASGPARRMPRNTAGYDGVAITVGGEGDVFRWELKWIAYAMSKAYAHVGVDSAFFHLAQLYMPMSRIHLHCGEKRSHHVLRAIDNGARIN